VLHLIPSPAPGAAAAQAAADHPTMSAASVFTLMLIALFVDGARVGSDGVRHRVAFLLAVTSIRAGWDGSAADRWTVGQLSTAITELAKTGNKGLHIEHADDVIGALIGVVMLYAIGVMMPVRWSRIPWVGKWANATFGTSKGKFNPKLWGCAIVLGLMSDLTGGVVGGLVNTVLSDILVPLCGHIPDWLFGKVEKVAGNINGKANPA
jgi:hypothetical protein